MVGSRIKEIIEYLGENKTSFSKKIGVTNNVTIGRIINEGRNPSFEVLNKIVNAYPEINPAWLLTGEGQMINKGKGSFDLSNKEIIEYIIHNKEELLKNQAFREMLDILDIDRAIIAEKKKQKSMIDQFRERMMKKHGYSMD